MPVVNQPELMIANATTRFDQHGRLTDMVTRVFIRKLIAALIHLVRINQASRVT